MNGERSWLREIALRAEFKEREKAFINEHLKRDYELLKILEVSEKEMEKNLLQKAYAFGYLYKEHQKGDQGNHPEKG